MSLSPSFSLYIYVVGVPRVYIYAHIYMVLFHVTTLVNFYYDQVINK